MLNKRIAVLVGVFTVLAAMGAASVQGQSAPDLRDRGEAPELENNVFLNTETPLRLADLRGQVVLLKFWTFDCINCIRTLPHIERWYETYADEGFTVIGNHYPEFRYERDLGNVEAALTRLNVNYPVAQDNARATWRAYNQRFWPTIYLIDKQGHIRYMHIGEGRYDTTEAAIQTLLAEEYVPETVVNTSADTVETVERQYVRPTEPLNVRRGPGIEYERVATVSPEVVFVVLSEENGWYEIEYDGQPGFYLSGDYLEVDVW